MQTYIIKKTEKTGGRENSLKTVVERARATGYYREADHGDVSPITPSRQVNTLLPHGPRAPRETENKNRGSDETPSCCSQSIQPHLRPCIACPAAIGVREYLAVRDTNKKPVRAGQSSPVRTRAASIYRRNQTRPLSSQHVPYHKGIPAFHSPHRSHAFALCTRRSSEDGQVGR